MKYVYIIIATLIITSIIFVIILFLKKKKRKMISNQYWQMLSQSYKDKKIVDCLQEVRGSFKKGSMEYIAVDKAIFYLTRSIMRDYETAFAMIEKAFGNKEIKELHTSIVEQEKANIVYLLH